LSEHPMKDDYISILKRDGPGCQLERPMAIVYIDDEDNPASPLRENATCIPTPAHDECSM